MNLRKIAIILCRYRLIPRKFHFDIYQYCEGHTLLLTRVLAYTKTKVLLDVGDYIQYWMYVDGAYEDSFLKFVRSKLISSKGAIVDAGANVGSYTLNLYDKADHIIAVEASGSNAAFIRSVCALNHIKNVRVYNNALYKTDGELIELYVSNDTCGNNSMYKITGYSEVESVQTLTIDTICAENGVNDIRLIKIDIEGAEYNCLLGAKKTIERYRPIVLCEFNRIAAEAAGYDLSLLYGFFKERDYEAFLLDEHAQRLLPFEERELEQKSFANNLFLIPKK